MAGRSSSPRGQQAERAERGIRGNALLGGARQVSFGLAAAALTFAIGNLLGVSLGG